MNLKQLRDLFIQRSGRIDMDATYETQLDDDMNEVPVRTVAGEADEFIRGGQKYLERLTEKFSRAVCAQLLPAGEYGLLVYGLRTLEELYVSNGTTRVLIPRCLSLREFYSKYPLPSKAQATELPTEFVVNYERMSPEWINFDTGVFYAPPTDSFAARPTGDHAQIIFNAPLSSETHIEVYGKFTQPTLVADTDSNILSESFSDLLLMASLRQLEVFYRNTEGVNDWTRAIQEEVYHIESDVVEDQSNNYPSIRG